MQAALQFFDLPLKGLGTEGIQKIGIKMTGGKSDTSGTDDGGFAEIMDALMALSPEQLQASLRQMEWVPVEGIGDLFAPVIDMNCLNKAGEGIVQNLPKETVQAILTSPLDSSLVPLQIVEDSKVHEAPQLVSTEKVPQIQPEHSAALAHEKISIHNGLEGHILRTASQSASIAREGTKVSNDPIIEKGTLQNTAILESKIVVGDTSNTTETGKDAARAKALETAGVNEKAAIPEAVKSAVVSKLPDVDKADLSVSEPRQSGRDQHTARPMHNNPSIRSEFQSSSTVIDDQQRTEGGRPGLDPDAKPKMVVTAEKFKAVTDTLPNSNDKMVNAAHQIKELPVKEAGRQVAQPASGKAYLDNVSQKVNKVQPNSSAKDASLSFTSRWNGMTDNTLDTVADAKASSATTEKTDPNDLIRQIVQRMTMRSNRRQSQMNIKLKPEFLGNVRMQIITNNQQVAVRMMAESGAVKEIIEQNIQYLKAELQQHGLEIDKFEVSVGKESDENRHGQQHDHLQQRSSKKGRSFAEKNPGKFSSKDDETKEQQPRVTTSSSESEIDYFV